MNTLYKSPAAWTTKAVTFCAQNRLWWGSPVALTRGGGEVATLRHSAATFWWSYARRKGQGAMLNTRLPITSYISCEILLNVSSKI